MCRKPYPFEAEVFYKKKKKVCLSYATHFVPKMRSLLNSYYVDGIKIIVQYWYFGNILDKLNK